jgi:spore photoproduct lyase
MHLKLQKIIVEEEIAGLSKTKDIISRFKGVPVEYTTSVKRQKSGYKNAELIIAKQRGPFIKKCPGTCGYSCCDYYIINLGIGCSFNCTYCYLNQYMNTPFIAYVNIEDAVDEIKKFCSDKSSKIVRLGSGEFIDSIGFDGITNYNKVLIPKISNIANLLYEIKTKSSQIDHLLELKHNNKVVISWSLNTEKVIAEDELGAANLNDRIKAAKKCQEAGYKIGFHFDPLIYYDNWQTDYKNVVDLIFKNINPENIAWISLGALRFNPKLKKIIMKKFPNSRIIYEELIPGLDGKLRYFIAIRKKMFKTMVRYIGAYSKDTPVYLCMENKSLAREVGAIPSFFSSKQ